MMKRKLYFWYHCQALEYVYIVTSITRSSSIIIYNELESSLLKVLEGQFAPLLIYKLISQYIYQYIV